jgi:hypothetical protein
LIYFSVHTELSASSGASHQRKHRLRLGFAAVFGQSLFAEARV